MNYDDAVCAQQRYAQKYHETKENPIQIHIELKQNRKASKLN